MTETGFGFTFNAMFVDARLLRLSLLFVVVALSAFKECAGSSPPSSSSRPPQPVSRVDLTVLPAIGGQSVLEGGSFRIICRVMRVSYPFDLVRIVRRIGETDYEIATNGYLAERYRRTGRYRIVRWEDGGGLLEVEIEFVLGADGGNIGCQSLPGGESKFQDVIVKVPLRKIELVYRTIDGTNHTVDNGENIRLQRGIVGSVGCHVHVTGSDFGPEVVVRLGAQDMTSLFEKRVVKVYEDNGGFVDAAYSAVYEWDLDGRNGTWAAEVMHGRNLTCVATMPMFPQISTSAVVEAEHSPVVHCDKDNSRWNRPGKAVHRLSCETSAFPQPDWMTWSWMDGNEEESLTWKNGDGNSDANATRFQISVTPLGNDKYDVILSIDDVRPSDFRSYVLRIGNRLGATEVSVQLRQHEEANQVAMYNEKIQTQHSTTPAIDSIAHDAGDLQPSLEMLMSNMTPAMTHMTHFVWMTAVGVTWLLGRCRHDVL